ncbi:MAG: hypothetical protein QOE57_1535 [Acidimicrobiaceae bacterium]|nr:hypothetical protein [Acidimicrobiaceae bacterium]
MTEPASLQARLSVADPRTCPPDGEMPSPDARAGAAGVTDPVGLFRHLESSGRFHRDTGLGRMFHPGSVSLRENRPTDSLHIVVHQNHVSAHVDRVSPLHLRPERRPRYSLPRAVAHNLAGMAQDLLRLLRGRQGDHRAALSCRWVSDPSEQVPDPDDLLDPSVSAWSLQLEARVTGTLDETRLRRAFGEILDGTAADHEVLNVVDCPDDDTLDSTRVLLQAAPVRVSDWPPLNARLARHPGGDVLMLNINHAASDGVSAMRILRSLAEAYRGEGDRDAPPDFLVVGDVPVSPASAPVSRWKARYLLALERLRDLLAPPAQLASDQAGDDPGYGFHLVSLSADETRRIVDPGRPGRSRNILLAALHLAIGDWNLEHGSPGHRIGVLVQVNLRPPDWRDETVGNFSVTARVSTSRRHRRDRPSALAAITGQTTRNKRTRSGIALIAALDRSGLLPLWAKQSLIVLQPLTRNRLIDTAMLSNVGVLDEVPSFGPDAGETVDVWFSAPSRAARSVCIGAVTVAGRLHLVFRYPHRVFGPDAARRFAACYQAQLLGIAGSLPSGR